MHCLIFKKKYLFNWRMMAIKLETIKYYKTTSNYSKDIYKYSKDNNVNTNSIHSKGAFIDNDSMDIHIKTIIRDVN